ncbi:cupin-like domain-containing protein [Planctobacterium marinum]|uniref:cupin-like domain-containing protein n=1 Tax=Planctobacterium marinum TaxID=1631968 RepID=UPI001E42E2CA|nr:cupin-like domain-containing protein [Planctobacterium marinum]MCC2604611.1 cupin-like domain-containing protein [Planctobacterium marinum]
MAEIAVACEQTLPEGLLENAAPVILRGYVSEWPVVQQCHNKPDAVMAYLAGFYNHKPVHVMRTDASNNGRLFYNETLTGFNFSRSKDSLDQVFNELKQSEQSERDTLYVGSTAIDHILPGFRQDNDLPALHSKALVSIWLGNQSRIAAHYDAPDNIACVVAGRRRFTLFPPEQIKNLYIGPLDFTPAGQPASLVDFHNPDLKRFPLFEEALQHAVVADLGPGDAIYIPSMWWHHVEGLADFNVLINYWWRQVDNFIGAPADALMHAILSIRELPPQQRAYWREVFEHYVFSPEEQAHIPPANRGILNPLDNNTARYLRGLLLNKLNR